MRGFTRRDALITATAAAAMTAAPLRAETGKLRVSHGYSIGYLPLMVMRDQGLIEKHAAQAGLGKIAVEWQVQDGGNNINDAMLAGALDVAGTGIPGFLVLRDRTRGRRQEMRGIGALNGGALWLNSIDPRIRTLDDYTDRDRIAVPGIKTSYAAVILQMVVAERFGVANYSKLDPITVGLPHPEAYSIMMSGKTEITSHMASPPFSYQELKNPNVHRVLSTSDVMGTMTILLTMTQKDFADVNPGLMSAILAAQEEASAFIAADREAAAQTYVKVSKLNVPHDEMMSMLADRENDYNVAPMGSLRYAAFLAQIGMLRVKPEHWTELFLPILHGRDGS